MGIRYLKKHAVLEDVVTVEDAETLMQWLRAHERPAVHLGRCEHVHAAALQVLLALRPKVLAAPANARLAAALGVAPTGATP
jgi:hypothetical protein